MPKELIDFFDKDNPEVDAFEFISLNNLIKEINNNTRLFPPNLIKFLKLHSKFLKNYLQ